MEQKVFVVTHKKATFPIDNDLYEAIQVGAEQKEDLGYLKDNTGDNISIKNPNYCELTALYWMWKNVKTDVIGLVHYRRYFFKNSLSKNFKNLLSKEDVERIMKNYDIILPKKQNIIKYNLEKQYEKIHNKNDYDICKDIILEKYPDYMISFEKVFNQHSFYAFNMFIAKKEIINKYCEWLFNILFELEKRIDITSKDSYNQRIFGFLSERLFNVWLEKHHNELKIKEETVLQTEENILRQNIEKFSKQIYVNILITKNTNLFNILIGTISFIISIIFYYIGMNYITSAILIITGLFLFLFDKRDAGYYTNPNGIFSLIWFCTIGLSTLQLHQSQENWKLATWLYLGLTYIMFNIGYVFKERNITKKQEKNNPITKKQFFVFIIFAFLAVIGAFIIEVIIRGYIPMFSDDMASYQKFSITRNTLFYR